jgi:hypothetical protein
MLMKNTHTGRTIGRTVRRLTVIGSAAAVVCGLVAPVASAAIPGNGGFVSAAGRIWIMVGGAPAYVSSWAPYGGLHPTTPLTSAQWASIANRTVADNTFVRTIQNGRVYRFAGGAPIYVSTWVPFGGVKPVVNVDQANVNNAGRPYPWLAVARHPQDNLHSLWLRSGQTGQVYQSIGGAPVYVTAWDVFGGVQAPVITVDGTAINGAGGAGAYRFLRGQPLDGSQLKGIATFGGAIKYYVVAGGAPIFATDPTLLPHRKQYIVNQVVIDSSGGAAPYNNLLQVPADGTFIRGITSGRVYWIKSGAPLYVSSPTLCPTLANGTATLTNVEDDAINNAGTGGDYNHLNTPPNPEPPVCT